ncbi:MAG: hypothetical protein M0Z53_01340 [Thermaerobacter sp.]|nr:hypothetical protein [Thermaerobacter sp.]
MAIIEILGNPAAESSEAQIMRVLAGEWLPAHTVWAGRWLGMAGSSRRPFGRHPEVRFGWTWQGSRQGDIILVSGPSPELAEVPAGIRVGVPFSGMQRLLRERWGIDPHCLRIPIPEVYFAPGDASLVYDAVRTLRLEQRPRLVYAGGYENGRRLTAVLGAARAVLGGRGELVLVDGLAVRGRLAPVVHHLGMAEQVIFAPTLSDAMMAGLLHGADAIVAGVGTPKLPLLAHYATAAAVPIVGWQDPMLEQWAGGSVLAVHQESAWEPAIAEILENGRLRERMMERAQRYAAKRHAAVVAVEWLQAGGVG